MAHSCIHGFSDTWRLRQFPSRRRRNHRNHSDRSRCAGTKWRHNARESRTAAESERGMAPGGEPAIGAVRSDNVRRSTEKVGIGLGSCEAIVLQLHAGGQTLAKRVRIMAFCGICGRKHDPDVGCDDVSGQAIRDMERDMGLPRTAPRQSMKAGHERRGGSGAVGWTLVIGTILFLILRLLFAR